MTLPVYAHGQPWRCAQDALSCIISLKGICATDIARTAGRRWIWRKRKTMELTIRDYYKAAKRTINPALTWEGGKS